MENKTEDLMAWFAGGWKKDMGTIAGIDFSKTGKECEQCGGELTNRMAGDESYEKCTSCGAVKM